MMDHVQVTNLSKEATNRLVVFLTIPDCPSPVRVLRTCRVERQQLTLDQSTLGQGQNQ